MIEAIKDQDPEVRKAALAAVGKLGPVIGAPGAKEVMPTLLDAVQGKDAKARDEALETIAVLGPLAKEAVNPLITLMEKEDIKLYYNPQKSPTPFLQEKDDEFLNKIAKALGKIGKDAVKPLLRSVKTTNLNAGLLIGTCRALGEIGPPAKDALPDLRAISYQMPPEIGKEADRAMRKIRAK